MALVLHSLLDSFSKKKPVPEMPTTNVAVFVDYENIHISLERQYHIVPEPNKLATVLTEEIKKRGDILVGQAYADWEEYEGVQPAFKKHGIDPIMFCQRLLFKKMGKQAMQ